MPVNLDEKASKYFTWKELLWLPSFLCYHIPNEQEIANLTILAQKMDQIRDYLENPIHVNCAIRPICVNAPGTGGNTRNYNSFISGAINSAHIPGLACDFTVSRLTCDDVRHLLESKLEDFQIRMEKKPNSTWVHIDLRQPAPGGSRYFKP